MSFALSSLDNCNTFIRLSIISNCSADLSIVPIVKLIGIPIGSASGHMIIDLGGGTSEMAIISLGGIVANTSVRIGGNRFDIAIMEHIRRKYNLAIGERSAEEIKIGDVVVFKSYIHWPDEKIVVHRVSDVTKSRSGNLLLETKGDKNKW